MVCLDFNLKVLVSCVIEPNNITSAQVVEHVSDEKKLNHEQDEDEQMIPFEDHPLR